MKTIRSAVLVAAALGVVIACDDDALLQDFREPADAGPEAAIVIPPETEGGADATTDRRDANANDAPSTCSIENWCWTTLPGAQSLRGVWSDTLGSAWAVTTEGNVLRWDGSSWTVHWTAPGALNAIWGSGPTDLWIGGEKGLFHGQGSTASTITWTPVPFDAATPVVAIAGSGANDVWVIGNLTDYSTFPAKYTSLVRHYSGGETSSEEAWAVDPVSARQGLLRRILVRANGDAWLMGDLDGRFPAVPAYVLHRERVDGGDMAWVDQTVPYDTRDILASVSGAGFVGEDIRVLGWRAGSRVTSMWLGEAPVGGGTETWMEDTVPVTIDRHMTVWGTSKNDVYVAGLGGRFRHYDGTTWQLVRISIDGLPVVNNFMGSWVNPTNEVWLVGDKIAMHKQFSR